MKRIQVTIILIIFAFIAGMNAYAAVEINGIAYNISESGATVTYKSSGKYTGSITIPSTITYKGKTYKVTGIGKDAFSGCISLTSITIPNSVTSIDNGAFYGCIGLTTIDIPNSVTIIRESSFNGCTSLTSINIPNSVTYLGYSAFRGCTSLTSINIPNSVTAIDEYVFYGCTSLKSINIPNSVTSIGEYAFADCAWYNNQPDGLVYAGKVAYNYKGNMPANTSISIKEGTLGIAGASFDHCTGLTSIIIPNSVTNIGRFAFNGCTSLTNINIPNSVTTISSYAFSGCSSLTNINIPNSVAYISSWAFSNCTSLTSIVFPNSMKGIFKNTFYGSTSLTDIYCYATTPPYITFWNDDGQLFPSTCIVHIPIGTLSAYQNAEGWSDITNFIEDLSSTTTYEPIEGSGDDLQDYLNSFDETEDILTTTTYTREFRNTVWQSFFVPFTVAYADWSPYFEVAQLTGASTTNNTLQIQATLLTADNGTLEANIPYLIRAKKAGKYTLHVDTLQLKQLVLFFMRIGDLLGVSGSYTSHNVKWTEGEYCMIAGSLRSPKNYILPPYRWHTSYIRAKIMYSPISININDGTTVVATISLSEKNHSLKDFHTIYDLSGRRIAVSHLSELPKGVYIIDGKKLTIK